MRRFDQELKPVRQLRAYLSVFIVLETMVPVLVALLAWSLRDMAFIEKSSDSPRLAALSKTLDTSPRFLLLDLWYLGLLFVSGVAWAISPVPPGNAIVMVLKQRLHDGDLVGGAVAGAALAAGLCVLAVRFGLLGLSFVWAVFRAESLLDRPGLLSRFLTIPRSIRTTANQQGDRSGKALIPARQTSATPRHFGVATAVFFGYLAIAVAMAFVSLRGSNINETLISEHSSDPMAFLWFLAWWPFALSHGLNPLHTSFAWVPVGYNLGWTAPIPSLGILFAPLTTILSPVATYNVIEMLAPALGAMSAYLLASELGTTFGASIVAGLIFGFSPYEFAQQRGHINLIVTFVPPLIGYLWLKYIRGRLGSARMVALVAALLVFQFGVSNEIFVSLTLFVCLGLFLAFFNSTPSKREKVLSGIKLVAVAYFAATLLLLPYLFDMLVHLPRGAVNSPFGFSNDLAAFLVPDRLTLGGGHFATVTSRFIAKGSEVDAYVSVPLLALAAIFVFRSLRQRAQVSHRIVAICLVFSFLISLGPQLNVLGNVWLPPFSVTLGKELAILPWSIPARLPGLANMLPDRVSLFFDLFVALGVALLWSETSKGGLLRDVEGVSGGRTRRSRSRMGSLALVATLILGLVEIVPTVYNGALRTPISGPFFPRFFATSAFRTCLRSTDTVLVLPFGGAGFAMYYQAETDFYFRMAGGYLGSTVTSPVRDSLFDALTKYSNPPASGSALAALVLRDKINVIVITDNAGSPWTLYVSGLAPTFVKTCDLHGVSVYRHNG